MAFARMTGSLRSWLVASLAVTALPVACRPSSRLSDVSQHRQPSNVGRLVAIGDTHGDLAAARKALRLAGAVDAEDHWHGGRLVVVQTGDAIDRGDDDRAVLELFARLRLEAGRAGGAFVPLIGNHEAMNVAADFRYVSAAGFAAFANLASSSTSADEPPELAPEHVGRWLAFRPGGPIARQLAEHPAVLVLHDSAFVHGGILPAHVEYGLERINSELAAWMQGSTPAPESLLGRDGPLWTRFYAEADEGVICAVLEDALARIPAQRMVVGHTIQEGGITSACQGRLWRIDVGMSRFFGGPVEVLELSDEGARVLRAPKL